MLTEPYQTVAVIKKGTESFMDREENINEILAYYSSRKDKKEQEMIVAMLRELQEICGGISRHSRRGQHLRQV